MIGTAKTIASLPARGVALFRRERDTVERATARAPSIALFGQFGSGNFGNDGSLEAMLLALKRLSPDAQLSCICANPEVVEERFGVPAVLMSDAHMHKPRRGGIFAKLRKLGAKLSDASFALRALRTIDLLLFPGTGILDDFGEQPQGMPLNIFTWCLAARMMGTKIAFVSIGAGPIDNHISRWLMKSAARLAHYRSYRDALSKDFLSGIGLDTSADKIYPDLAFGLPGPPQAPRQAGGRLVVAVGVMNYFGWYGFAKSGTAIHAQYIDKLAAFVAYLLDRGYAVQLVAGETSDAPIAENLLQRLRSSRPALADGDLTAPPSSSLHDVMRQLAGTDLVVTTRYHNVVCALKLGKPTISLGYSKKNDVLMIDAGLADYCYNVETFDVAKLIAAFEQLCSHRDRLGDAARTFMTRVERKLAEQNEFIRQNVL